LREADTHLVLGRTIATLVVVALLGYVLFAGVRWVGRLPKTADGWLVAATDLGQRLRAAAIEVADDIGAEDLALQMRTDSSRTFPGSRYLRELNQRQPGAADHAYKLARKRQRRTIAGRKGAK
jgi:hypothetical protein